MRLLLVGNGGREHALCWKLAQSPLVENIFTASGNPGTAQIKKNENISIAPTDLSGLLTFASTEGIDLTIVGPEQPLSEGIVNQFESRKLRIFGPSTYSAQLESSKKFAKEVMRQAKVPTADYESFTNMDEAMNYLHNTKFPIVVKEDGLASGKGVMICNTLKEAQLFTASIFEKEHTESIPRVIFEKFLTGEEISFFIISDGRHYLPLTSAQDHKRLLDQDLGPNTGGMGAYSPSPSFTPELQKAIEDQIVRPVLNEMIRRENPYVGILYIGLMITSDGPYVLEFNVRWGDPEAQAILMRMDSDLADLYDLASRGRLSDYKIRWSPHSAITVVTASKEYPNPNLHPSEISGLIEAEKITTVFHAGTSLKEGKLLATGGRIFSVSATGVTLKEAKETAYRGVEAIHFEGKQFRKDIGWRALT